MYLVHLGILILLGAWLKGVPLALVGLLLTVIYASLSWFLMESKLLRAGLEAPSNLQVSLPQEVVHPVDL